MAYFKYEVIKNIRTLSENSKNSIRLRLISWNGNQPKYDLRKWSVDGDVPYKGVTLIKSELMKIYEILFGSIKIEKNKNIQYKVALDRASGKFMLVFMMC